MRSPDAAALRRNARPLQDKISAIVGAYGRAGGVALLVPVALLVAVLAFA